jgi:hypothetical protein
VHGLRGGGIFAAACVNDDEPPCVVSIFLKEAAKDLPLQYIRREIDNSLQKTEQKKKQKKRKTYTNSI